MCDELRVIFWQFVGDFSSAKVLKVKLNFLNEHIGFIIENNNLLATGATRMPMIPFDNNKADDLNEVSDVPGLSEYSFNCVQSCLRRVRLQFHLEDLNCFGVQLARFFAENALALEEMYTEDPNHGFK